MGPRFFIGFSSVVDEDATDKTSFSYCLVDMCRDRIIRKYSQPEIIAVVKRLHSRQSFDKISVIRLGDYEEPVDESEELEFFPASGRCTEHAQLLSSLIESLMTDTIPDGDPVSQSHEILAKIKREKEDSYFPIFKEEKESVVAGISTPFFVADDFTFDLEYMPKEMAEKYRLFSVNALAAYCNSVFNGVEEIFHPKEKGIRTGLLEVGSILT